MIREQNHGLALELGGHEFKPRINKTSQELAATMKSLQVRLPEMLAEREKSLNKRREEISNVCNILHGNQICNFANYGCGTGGN